LQGKKRNCFVVNVYNSLEEITIRIDADSLLVLKEMVVLAIPDALSLSGLPASSTSVTTGSPARPRTPALLLISIKFWRFLYWRSGSLAAVVLLVVVSSKLLAIVTPAHEVSLTARVSVIETSISRSVTVSLSFTTRLLWSTTSLPVVVTAPTSLTCRRLKRSAGHEDRFLSDREVLGSVTAVVLLMEIGSKLSAIVTPTHEVSLAALVTVMSTAVKRSVTVSLP